MATTGRTLSPGGALLRASRMFSLPSAIPPASDFEATSTYHSNTATQPYPTLQTVTVPEKFRQRGDWGFKRHFPLRSTTKTGTPYLRIKHVDSVEHVTDFNSAADHALTLEKFQAMNVPITVPKPKDDIYSSDGRGLLPKKYEAPSSVFEDKHDFTALDADKINKAGASRWKYRGPFLANLSEGEFQGFLKRQVRGRKAEFREFLKVQLCPILTQEARQRAMEQGLDQETPEVRPEDVTEEQVMEFLRTSRESRYRLFQFVSKFLDLAPIADHNYVDHMRPGEQMVVSKDDPYALTGPPITHPSAGLSYLRTNAFLENHPVYGPQAEHRPVKARVMTTYTGDPLIGVGGFVTRSQSFRKQFRSRDDQIDLDAPGGPKIWVKVNSATVKSTGHVLLNVDPPTFGARMVEEEMQGERQVFHQETEEALAARLKLRDNRLGPRSSRAVERNQTWIEGNRYGLSRVASSTSAEGSKF